MTHAFVSVRELTKEYPVVTGFLGKKATLTAVSDISFDIGEGKTFGLVGESGSGKTTTARMILGAEPATSGSVKIDGKPLMNDKGRVDPVLRRMMQPVLQDPYTSLSPRMCVGHIIDEPLRTQKLLSGERALAQRVSELLDMVGLPQDAARRYPNELSGGQRQRVAIARAIAPKPRFLVLDEPVSALDVSIQAQVLNLLKDLQSEFKLTYLLISHDLSVVSFMSDAIGVMYLGRFMEIGPKDEVLRRSSHPYTMILKSAASTDEGAALPISGEIPSPLSPPSGCPFHTRCPFSQQICATTQPELEAGPAGQFSACHFAKDIRAGKPAGTCATLATGAMGR